MHKFVLLSNVLVNIAAAMHGSANSFIVSIFIFMYPTDRLKVEGQNFFLALSVRVLVPRFQNGGASCR